MASASCLIISSTIPSSSSSKWVSIPMSFYQNNNCFKRFYLSKSFSKYTINPSRPATRNPKTLIVRAAEYKFPDPIPEFAEAETEKFRSHLIEKLSKKDVFEDSVDEVVEICTEIFGMSVEIKLSRSNRTYHPNEPLQGKIITKLPSSLSHRGIQLTVNGSVNLQVRGGSAGLIESLYGVLKPVRIVKKSIEVQPSGKITAGTTQIPFSIILNHKGEDIKFYETFHGANINIQYLLTVDIVRGYLHKSLTATVEFIIESELANLPQKPVSPETVFFYITQDTQRHALLPELKSGGFKVSGRICTQCLLSDPLVGELTVETSAVPIYSIDVHLLRVESIMVGEKIATETSIVQTTQIADGDVCRTISLPIYLILPRLLTCPTVFAGPFSVEFKVTIVVTFQTELYNVQPKSDPRSFRKWVAMESLPLELVQSQ